MEGMSRQFKISEPVYVVWLNVDEKAWDVLLGKVNSQDGEEVWVNVEHTITSNGADDMGRYFSDFVYYPSERKEMVTAIFENW
jgi:hypothetical protein